MNIFESEEFRNSCQCRMVDLQIHVGSQAGSLWDTSRLSSIPNLSQFRLLQMHQNIYMQQLRPVKTVDFTCSCIVHVLLA